MNTRLWKFAGYLLIIFSFAACGGEGEFSSDLGSQGPTPEEKALLEAEAPIGEVNEPGEGGKEDDFYHNGEEDFSERCKPIPDLPALEDPEIIISLDGLTLRLRDRAGSYEKVFPIGAGRISGDQSLTPSSTDSATGLFWARADKPAIEDSTDSRYRKWAWNYSCRIWSGSTYYNPATDKDEYRSYFAGLPFIRLEGTSPAVYGLHGPITNYWREDGGDLIQGYVSGGCIRLEDSGILEIFARIRGHRTPVRVQQELDRYDDGREVDADGFVGSECTTDADCADADAECVDDALSGTSFCTLSCDDSSQCPTRFDDRASRPKRSHCVRDPLSSDPGANVCLVESTTTYNNGCSSFGGRLNPIEASAIGQSTGRVEVCAPSGDKWIGEACMVAGECATNQCVQSGSEAGFCSTACEMYCPDRAGEPITRCIPALDGSLEGGNCVARCDSDADCPSDFECQSRSFYGRSGSDSVCVPQ